MTEDLKVTAGYVRTLGGKQDAIAADIAGAKGITQGATQRVAFSHGAICYPTVMMVLAANIARDRACDAMRGVSDGLSQRLNSAAYYYDDTDTATKGLLDGTMGG